MQTEVLPKSRGIVSCHYSNDALSRRQRRPPRRDTGKALKDRLPYPPAPQIDVGHRQNDIPNILSYASCKSSLAS